MEHKKMKQTDTPRTDAVPSTQSVLTAQSDPVKLLDACVEYREQLDESKADLIRTQIEMQLEIDKAEAEVERLRELLNRALECLKVYGGILGVEAAKQISEELAPEPEEADHIVEPHEMVPEWRIKEKGEIIEAEDQYNSPMAGWVKAPWVGDKIETAGRIRTRRPLPDPVPTQPPTQNEWRDLGPEMPLEKELDYLTSESSRAADIHSHVVIVDCLRYLRDEIEQLKKNQK